MKKILITGGVGFIVHVYKQLMKAIKAKLKGCFILAPKRFGDNKGYFMESFNEKKFNQLTSTYTHFIEDNQSYSARGVLRCLLVQAASSSRAKLVQVLEGEVLDVAVDAGPYSDAFRQYAAVNLSATNNCKLFVARVFFHGFVVLRPIANFFYKSDNFYNKES